MRANDEPDEKYHPGKDPTITWSVCSKREDMKKESEMYVRRDNPRKEREREREREREKER